MLKTITEYRIMELLKSSKRGMTIITIAKILDVTYSHIYKLLKDLDQRGYVHITRNDKNRRIRIVKIAVRRRSKW